jgi:CDP-glycerol glycerophosphotransferase (TagB/SpsB family)
VNLIALRRSRAIRTIVRAIGVHRVLAAFGLLQLPFLRVAETLLPLLPRNRSLVVMGAPLDRFADNAAYLYVHMAQHSSSLRVVWITSSGATVDRLRSYGLDARIRWSCGGVAACLRAGTFVYSGYRSDINRLLSPGALAVSLWHGVPIKRVERDLASGPHTRHGFVRRLAEAGHEPPPDILLSSSEHLTQVAFATAFGVPPERCWELGYPRNDHLVAGEPPPDPLLWPLAEFARLRAADRVVGLFLTWRDNRVDDAIDADLIDRLAEVCARHGAQLAYKAHYNVAATPAGSENLVTLPSDADLQGFLGLCDVVITDYSSAALDFLLLRRPILYYMPDLEEYRLRRGFYLDPMSLPGEITRTPQSLLSSLDSTLGRPEAFTWTKRDEEFLQLVWGTHPGHSAAALADALAGHHSVEEGWRHR